MGMTLWIHTLEGRSLSKDSDDHSFMHRLSDRLDAVGVRIGLGKLSDYFDYTDLTHNLGDGFDEEFDGDDEEDSEPVLDSETGWVYGIDDMRWFDAAAGWRTIRGLHSAVEAGELSDLDDRERESLLWELDHCARILEEPAQRGAKFHLAVLM